MANKKINDGLTRDQRFYLKNKERRNKEKAAKEKEQRRIKKESMIKQANQELGMEEGFAPTNPINENYKIAISNDWGCADLISGTQHNLFRDQLVSSASENEFAMGRLFDGLDSHREEFYQEQLLVQQLREEVIKADKEIEETYKQIKSLQNRNLDQPKATTPATFEERYNQYISITK